MKNSWIAIDRNIQKHWVYEDPTSLKRWLTILMNVNFVSAKFKVGNDIHTCKPGQSYRSLENWGQLFGVSKKAALRFLQLIEKDGMIERKILGFGNQRKHLLIVANWDKYQNPVTRNDTENDTENAPKTTPDITIIYKEDKENNELFLWKEKFSNDWNLFCKHWHNKKKEPITEIESLSSLTHLRELSNSNPEEAGEIIQQAIRTGYVSFKKIKNDKNGKNESIGYSESGKQFRKGNW